MPFLIRKTPEGKFRLYNMHKKVYAKKTFNSRETAISQGLNWMRYRGEQGYVVGDKILHKKPDSKK